MTSRVEWLINPGDVQAVNSSLKTNVYNIIYVFIRVKNFLNNNAIVLTILKIIKISQNLDHKHF
jgi:hypothetical protein